MRRKSAVEELACRVRAVRGARCRLMIIAVVMPALRYRTVMNQERINYVDTMTARHFRHVYLPLLPPSENHATMSRQDPPHITVVTPLLRRRHAEQLSYTIV